MPRKRVRFGVGVLKFKTELSMLFAAIALFAVSTICYSYAVGSGSWALALDVAYPYRAYAVPFLSFGTLLMGVATFSYSKRSKNCP